MIIEKLAAAISFQVFCHTTEIICCKRNNCQGLLHRLSWASVRCLDLLQKRLDFEAVLTLICNMALFLVKANFSFSLSAVVQVWSNYCWEPKSAV